MLICKIRPNLIGLKISVLVGSFIDLEFIKVAMRPPSSESSMLLHKGERIGFMFPKIPWSDDVAV